MNIINEPSLETLAKRRADEKEALFILKKIRYYADQLRSFRTQYNTDKLEYWELKADVLLRNIPVKEKIPDPTKNFKSLLGQYKEGLFYERSNNNA